MLLETNDFQSPELHRLRAAVKKSSERICHHDDVFWRLLLCIENERKDTLRAREVLFSTFQTVLIFFYKEKFLFFILFFEYELVYNSYNSPL